MNVVAFLQASALAQLLRALPPPHRVTNVGDWPAVVTLTRQRHFDAAVIDPTFGADLGVSTRVQAIVESAHTTPVIAYVAVTATAIKAAQSIARLVPPDVSNVVVRGVDDAPDAFAATIHRVVASSAAAAIVSSAGDPFDALPPPVARAVEAAFHRPERVRSVSALASEARTTRRSLDRWLARTGLASARTLLACARANAAFHLLSTGHIHTARAAAMIGYTSSRALARELHALTGHAPSAIPDRLTRAEFARSIGRRLRRTSRVEQASAAPY